MCCKCCIFSVCFRCLATGCLLLGARVVARSRVGPLKRCRLRAVVNTALSSLVKAVAAVVRAASWGAAHVSVAPPVLSCCAVVRGFLFAWLRSGCAWQCGPIVPVSRICGGVRRAVHLDERCGCSSRRLWFLLLYCFFAAACAPRSVMWRRRCTVVSCLSLACVRSSVSRAAFDVASSVSCRVVPFLLARRVASSVARRHWCRNLCVPASCRCRRRCRRVVLRLAVVHHGLVPNAAATSGCVVMAASHISVARLSLPIVLFLEHAHTTPRPSLQWSPCRAPRGRTAGR